MPTIEIMDCYLDVIIALRYLLTIALRFLMITLCWNFVNKKTTICDLSSFFLHTHGNIVLINHNQDHILIVCCMIVS